MRTHALAWCGGVCHCRDWSRVRPGSREEVITVDKRGQGPSLEGGQRPSLIYLACKWMSIIICSVPYEEIVKGLESSQFTEKGIQTTLKQMKRYAALIIIKEMQNKTSYFHLPDWQRSQRFLRTRGD